MKKLSDKNSEKLQQRVLKNAIRVLGNQSSLIDFSSNDYLGFAKSETIFHRIHQFLIDNNIKQNGATGSRLISGNHILYSKVEGFLSNFHESESATIFNSGYDANIGFFSSVPQRGDVILYDEFIHASIRDGIQLSNAKSFKFSHNDLENLEERILHFINNENSDIYVVTESVFSMDGDSPDLVKASEICKKHNAFLIIDEAHAIGVFGKNGCGLIQQLNIQNQVFVRIITFGKALGCHGAAILGSQDLQNYLINFARSFIYTTGLSPHSLATIQMTYNEMINESSSFDQNHILNSNIDYFLKEIKRLNLNFIASHSTIHCCVISGNKKVKLIAEKIQKNGFGVKAILSPTVPENKERLRFCLHSYNSKQEISEVLELLSNFVK